MLKIILALALGSASAKFYSNNTEHMSFMFREFKSANGRNYATMKDEIKAYNTFVENMKIVDERNEAELANGGRAVHGITIFSDMSQEDFATRYLLSKPAMKSGNAKVAKIHAEEGTSYSADWTGTYTTPVKDQGACGSCWAFSATEQIESDAMRTLGDSYILSPAQIAQCDESSYGCNGGWTENAYEYVENNGIAEESEYPYPSSMSKGATGSCASPMPDPVVSVSDYYTINGETSMAKYVGETGPLSVCLDASSWSSYTGGIMSICGNSVDHCVQAVGVDTGNGYWKVRNSWGTSWGESGFIYLSYGSNTCDITNDPTYVEVSNLD